MCCEEQVPIPPIVADMLRRYRDLLAENGADWGRDLDEMERALSKVARFCDQGQILAAWRSTDPVQNTGTMWQRVLDALPDPLPPGIAVVGATGIDVGHPLPYVEPGSEIPYVVVTLDSEKVTPHVADMVVASNDPWIGVNGHRVQAAESVSMGRLRLVSDADSRWSVVDERGGGWFPPGRLRKHDFHGRPYFHGNDVCLDVPAGPMTVSVGRGCEFRPTTIEVAVPVGEEVVVELRPRRLHDPAAHGWYGGDLHVHLNYSGAFVATPEDAALMQRGEGLHLMNLVAANCSTSLVYDQEALEAFAGSDLPWSNDESVARWGVEYRNDLFGHFHALNPSGPPTRYQTGHARSDQPQDWPPNSVVAAEFRDLGATVGYTHPVLVPMGDDGSPAAVFEKEFPGMGLRTQHARELVADAALGLVDAMDLTGNGNLEATEHLYHRLLGCGLRLAATAGTDVMLSHSHGMLANPPGWSRAYANLEGRPLSVEAWQDAVRAGRTFATNGPWLELDVAGRGPGDTISSDGTTTVPVIARLVGVGVERLEVVGPEGTIAVADLPKESETAVVTTDLEVQRPLWVAAVARGKGHPDVLGPQVYAHTSPVWIDVDGKSVARASDAVWCLDWLGRFEKLARKAGHFTTAGQLEDVIAVIEGARVFYRRILDDRR